MLKRLEITVPTNAPFNTHQKIDLKYWKEKSDDAYFHGAWVNEVVKTLTNKDKRVIKPDARGYRDQAAIDFTEEYLRYPARDGQEYSRIRSAFEEMDVDKNGRLDKKEFLQLLDKLNREADDAAGDVDAEHKRLLALHRHRERHKSCEGGDAATTSDVHLGLSPIAAAEGQDQDHILSEIWDHIVKPGLGQGESADDAEMTFDEFREWWPRDDTTVFVVTTHHAEALVRRLQRKGIGMAEHCPGTKLTQTNVETSIPDPPDQQELRKKERLDYHNQKSVCVQFFLHCRIHGHSLAHYALGTGGHSRSTIKEIYMSVHAGAARTFNFTVDLLAAGVIAGVGIAGNSSVATVASMLISPMMGPILAIAFGSAITDFGKPFRECPGKMMLLTGIQNTFITILEVWLIGFIQGFIYAPWAREFLWPTPEMTGRGDPINLLAGILVATASGFVVGVAITGGGINALVGVAISASLLPPIVNCGICCAFAIMGPSWFDCMGARIASGDENVTRYMPRNVDGTSFLLPAEVENACTVSDCGAWSLDDKIACDEGHESAPYDSCACRYGVEIDPHSPWIRINSAGTPVMFDSAAYVHNGFISLALFFLNFGIIYVVCLIVFHYKRIKASRASNLLMDQVHVDPHMFHPGEIMDFVNSFPRSMRATSIDTKKAKKDTGLRRYLSASA